ncbi:MAG: CatB-related O-acetyltransferase [Pseudomonadota bacterium]
MPFTLPDPTSPYPVILPDRRRHKGTVHLSEAVRDHPRFHAGAHSYASDFDPPPLEGWAGRLAPYLFPFSRETLTVGKFCQIAHGVRFITSSANHAMDGLTAYPFTIFEPERMAGFQPDQRDTIIGHDVWIGYGATILPGARIGHGAIIGAQAVVRGVVPDYAIVIGNPGQVARFRLSEDQIKTLLELSWWDWPTDRIAAAREALEDNDVAALARFRPD